MSQAREALGAALGRVPSGLFIAACGTGEQSVPFVASWIQQCDLEEPMLSMAVQQGRPALEALDAQGGAFTLSILPEGRHDLMKPFFAPDPERPFGDLETSEHEGGGRYLSEALAWLSCVETGRIEAGAHMLVVARVLEGGLLREGDPAVHIRKTGFSH